jgi:protein-tyrosine phosphatase
MIRPQERRLKWQGCFNIRDLGGIVTADGQHRTRWGAVVRGDSPIGFELASGAPHHGLTEGGWRSLKDHGIRTIISLREVGEEYPEALSNGISIVHCPLDNAADTTFWAKCCADGVDVPPLYFPRFLEEKLDRCASALMAVADAPPGGVFVHCRYGRDRTGFIAMLLLALAGVSTEEIAEDYVYSNRLLPRMYESLRLPDDRKALRRRLRRRSISLRSVLRETMEKFAQVRDQLSGAGLPAECVQKLMCRLVESPATHSSAGQESE